MFTGDIGFDKYMDGRWRDDDLLSKEVRALLENADHVIVNVEGPLMDTPTDAGSEGVVQLKHCMSSGVAPFLTRIGADIWSLCNNHIMDAGPDGLKSTLELAKAQGAMTLGAGVNICEAKKPVILREAGGIGMICVGYQRACRAAAEDIPGCYRWDALDDIEASIKSIKKSCRWCIVVAHAGEEFTPLPSPYTRERYLKYLEMGADIVVAHHPHVPMNYETVGDKTIFYSLGNFIFDTDYQRSQHYTDVGILLNLRFTEQDYSFEAHGIRVVRGREEIVTAPLPDIFENVGEEDYKLLLPLSVKAFIEATKRQLKYLNPGEFSSATDEKWKENFMQPLRSGRVPGETLDFKILCPIADQAEKGDWRKSGRNKIIDFILNQMQPV
ncbi:MAG: CapA family protein [Lachnospiraceae bacterium]|nr:CapA family protein [Lachnospiraceae bacterium]